MRKPLIAGNWKMYKTAREAEDFVTELLQEPWPAGREVLLCAPFTALSALRPFASRLALGAQDLFWEDEGAFTGEISAPMLADAGCTYVLVGHSERRQWFGENDLTVGRKMAAAARSGLVPVCCVGETQEEREKGAAQPVVWRQLQLAVAKFPATADLVLAYEPVWAIGTGRSATAQDAQEMAAWLRQCLQEFLPGRAEDVRILYGGSVKADTISALMALPDVDGVLVGGASLTADSFGAIVRFA
jgi:triosephosphate isomerase